jgi:hypothetical protein
MKTEETKRVFRKEKASYEMLRRFRKRNTKERKLRRLMPLKIKNVAVA